MKRTISMILAIVMMLGMFCMTASAENATLAALDIQMLDGASIRVGTVAGIRYSTLINKAQLDALTENNTVEIGTIIAPTQYVTDAGAFTMAALDQFKTENNIENATYVKVPATVGTPLKTVTVDETEYYVYAGSLENIKDANQTLAFSGIGYVKIGEDVVYATYNNTNSRSVGYVAYRAYMDPDFKAEFGTDGQGLIDDFAVAYLKTGVTIYSEDFSGYTDIARDAFDKTPTYAEYLANNTIAFPHLNWINSTTEGENAADETAAVMNALGWSTVKVDVKGWDGKEYMRITKDGKLYWYNWGTNYPPTYKDSFGGNCSITRIDALNGDHMDLVAQAGYTLQYDVMFTADTGYKSSNFGMGTHLNKGNAQYYGLYPDGGTEVYTLTDCATVKKQFGASYSNVLGLTGSTGKGESATYAPDYNTVLENVQLTVKQVVGADGSVTYYIKTAEMNEFYCIGTAQDMATTGGNGIGFICNNIINAYIDNISVTTHTAA